MSKLVQIGPKVPYRRKPGPKQEFSTVVRMKAKYDSKCNSCKRHILAGTEIDYNTYFKLVYCVPRCRPSPKFLEEISASRKSGGYRKSIL